MKPSEWVQYQEDVLCQVSWLVGSLINCVVSCMINHMVICWVSCMANCLINCIVSYGYLFGGNNLGPVIITAIFSVKYFFVQNISVPLYPSDDL